MIRKFDILLIVAMLCAAGYTYSAKHTTKRYQKELVTIERQIKKEKDSIALLRAEWGLLTQPAKLQVLVEQFGDELDLMTLDPAQIVSIDDIPMRPERNEEIDALIAAEQEAPVVDGEIETSGVEQ